MRPILTSMIIICFIISAVLSLNAGEKNIIRVGYFPNITHSQALIGMANGAFQKAMGDDVKIVTRIFNAGPSVIEAMFADEIDLAYIGPNPAINGYVKSKGEVVRIVAGATSAGAALVVRSDSGINSILDFHNRRIASPQLGNTQDVALRAWLKNNGFKLKENGGDVQVLPVQNPDQLTLFIKKEIDAAWTVEPWVSRLIHEGGGRLFLDERSLWRDGEFVTAHVIVNKKFLDKKPDLVKKWIGAHVGLTIWINNNLEEAKKIINSEIQKITSKALPDEVIDDAFKRIKITYDPIKDSLFLSAKSAFEEGFLGKDMPDLSNIYDLRILRDILKERGLASIKE